MLDQDPNNEEWKDVVGYEDHYEVSNIGRIRSKLRQIKTRNRIITKKSIIRTPHITKKGYHRIQLVKNGKKENKFIHTLVAECFIGTRSNNYQVNHKDGIKINNIVSNLEWITPSQNLQHAYDNKLKLSKAKYIVKCNELNITTIGCSKMEKELRKLGYEKASSSAIHRCITSKTNASHLDLTFEKDLISI